MRNQRAEDDVLGLLLNMVNSNKTAELEHRVNIRTHVTNMKKLDNFYAASSSPWFKEQK